MLPSRSRSARARTKWTKGIHERPRFSRKRPTQLCPSSCALSPLLSFPFPLPLTQTLGHSCRGLSMGSHQTPGLFQQSRERAPLMWPRAATLPPPAFQRPLLGYCVHILSLFIHSLEGPRPAAPCPSHSRPDPQIKAPGLTGQSCYQSRHKQHHPRCSCQDKGSSARPTPQG